MKLWELTVFDVPPSANELMRMHWTKMRRLKEAWAYYLIESGVHGIPRCGVQKRTADFTLFVSKIRDEANNYLGCDKLIIDNLVKYGILHDDSPEFLTLKISQTPAARTKTVIKISEGG